MKIRLVKVVVQLMGDVFPELRQHEVHIRDIIAAEEASFGKTLLNVSLTFCLHFFRLLVRLCGWEKFYLQLC